MSRTNIDNDDELAASHRADYPVAEIEYRATRVPGGAARENQLLAMPVVRRHKAVGLGT
jgi:hypothetical protein